VPNPAFIDFNLFITHGNGVIQGHRNKHALRDDLMQYIDIGWGQSGQQEGHDLAQFEWRN
jgi:hypothetical protein